MSLPGAAVCFFQYEGFVAAPVEQTWAKEHLSGQLHSANLRYHLRCGWGPIGRLGLKQVHNLINWKRWLFAFIVLAEL